MIVKSRLILLALRNCENNIVYRRACRDSKRVNYDVS